jgi:hypothetical protein
LNPGLPTTANSFFALPADVNSTAYVMITFENPLAATSDPVISVVLDEITADSVSQGAAVPVPAPLLGSGLSGLVSGLALAFFLITGRATLRCRQA